jgi:hypothetical protein
MEDSVVKSIDILLKDNLIRRPPAKFSAITKNRKFGEKSLKDYLL